MAKRRKVPEGSKIGPAVYYPDKRQCWFCLHNTPSDLCCNCLHRTELFEISKGVFGEYKPAWEYGTVDDIWEKGED